MSQFEVIAHRGRLVGGAENSVSSLVKLAERGIFSVEFDFLWTDSGPFLFDRDTMEIRETLLDVCRIAGDLGIHVYVDMKEENQWLSNLSWLNAVDSKVNGGFSLIGRSPVCLDYLAAACGAETCLICNSISEGGHYTPLVPQAHLIELGIPDIAAPHPIAAMATVTGARILGSFGVKRFMTDDAVELIASWKHS